MLFILLIIITMDCQICCEKINKSTRLEIKCNYCDYSACRHCFQKYISETILDPHCMNCKKFFPISFLNDNCTGVFISKTLKCHRENILMEREKSFLPDTQKYVIMEKSKIGIHKKIKVLNEEKNKLLAQVDILNQQVQNHYRELTTITNNINNGTDDNGNNDNVNRFVRKCPVADCRGFLNNKWKCGICDTLICKKCNEVKIRIPYALTDTHECDPKNVLNMELINKDTKPCPSCGTMIFKSEGCLQMFCTECHTAFNWNTGIIETGVVHNPHYYEYLRLQNNGVAPRNAGDVPCGGIPEVVIIDRLIRMYKIPIEFSKYLYNIHRVINHIQHSEIRSNNDDILNYNDERGKRTNRIEFLLNQLTEENFKILLQQKEKGIQKRRDFNNIFEMFVEVTSDIFRQLIINHDMKLSFIGQLTSLTKNDIDMIAPFIDQLTLLIKYFNENLGKLGKQYKCVYPGISKNFTWVYNYETYLKQERMVPVAPVAPRII